MAAAAAGAIISALNEKKNSIAGFASKGIGALFQNKANKKLQKASKRALTDLQGANRNALSAYDLTRDRLADAPMLDMDASAYDAATAQARANLSNAGSSRVAAEEAMRDSQRRATADAIARARSVGGSVADMLGFTASASADERGAMQNIDINAMQAREQRREAARGRLQGALANKAAFDERAQVSEFQRRSDVFDTGMQMDLNRIGMERGFTMDEIAQQGAVARSKAERWRSLGNIFGDVGGDFLQMQQMENMRRLQGYGADSGGGSTGAASKALE